MSDAFRLTRARPPLGGAPQRSAIRADHRDMGVRAVIQQGPRVRAREESRADIANRQTVARGLRIASGPAPGTRLPLIRRSRHVRDLKAP